MAQSLKPLPTLKKRQAFLSLRSAPRFSCPAFVLQGNLERDGDGLNIGYTVTKKTGNAVERNRIKRRLRMAAAEAFNRCNRPGKGMAEHSRGSINGQVIIVARRACLGTPHGMLVANLTKGIDRLLAKGKKAGTNEFEGSKSGNRGD